MIILLRSVNRALRYVIKTHLGHRKSQAKFIFFGSFPQMKTCSCPLRSLGMALQ